MKTIRVNKLSNKSVVFNQIKKYCFKFWMQNSSVELLWLWDIFFKKWNTNYTQIFHLLIIYSKVVVGFFSNMENWQIYRLMGSEKRTKFQLMIVYPFEVRLQVMKFDMLQEPNDKRLNEKWIFFQTTIFIWLLFEICINSSIKKTYISFLCAKNWFFCNELQKLRLRISKKKFLHLSTQPFSWMNFSEWHLENQRR